VNKRNGMSEEEKQELVTQRQQDLEDLGRKLDSNIGGRIRKLVRWLCWVGAAICLLIGLPSLLSGQRVLGIVFIGLATILIARSLQNASLRKVVLAVVFTAVGVLFALLGLNMLEKAKESLDWPTTTGTVTLSEVRESTRTSGTGSNRKKHVDHKAHVEYSYQVQRETYAGSRISFNPPNEGAGQITSRYPVGKQIQVYYSPDEPQESVLEPGVAKTSYLFIGFGGLFALLGLSFLVSSLRALSRGS